MVQSDTGSGFVGNTDNLDNHNISNYGNRILCCIINALKRIQKFVEERKYGSGGFGGKKNKVNYF